MELINRIIAQSDAQGALPSLFAATAPDARGGAYYGPDFLLRGHPARSPAMPAAHNPRTARRLWEVSEELTGVMYEALRLDPQVQRE